MDIDFALIKSCREQINELIAQRPELAEFQQYIDNELEKAGSNPHNRSATLNRIAMELQEKLAKAVNELDTEVRHYLELYKKME